MFPRCSSNRRSYAALFAAAMRASGINGARQCNIGTSTTGTGGNTRLHHSMSVIKSLRSGGLSTAMRGALPLSFALSAVGGSISPAGGSMAAMAISEFSQMAAALAASETLEPMNEQGRTSLQQHDKRLPTSSGRTSGASKASVGAGSAAAPSSVPEDTILSKQDYLTKHNIVVKSEDVPEPVQEFSQLQLPPPILATFHRMGYTKPTPVQAVSWPFLLDGRDVVAIASTGSGKTVGFLLPALWHVARQRSLETPSHRGGPAAPAVVVLAPTRELAKQIGAEAVKLCSSMKIRVTCLYGGASVQGQAYALESKPSIVVATPGRLNDFIKQGLIDLRQCNYLVLDEADCMLDMGFEPQIQEITNSLPAKRQSVMFSATWPRSVQQAAQRFAPNNPTHIFIGDVSGRCLVLSIKPSQSRPVANRDIRQLVRLVDHADKYDALRTYLSSKGKQDKVLLFCSTKLACEQLTRSLRQDGLQVATIHGDCQQAVRDRVLSSFRQGTLQVLVATDVAARGLDVKNVAAVVNYGFPNSAEMYVHRIGRTGRAGATGESFTLLTKPDAPWARTLVNIMREAKQHIPEELETLASSTMASPTSGGAMRRRSYGAGGNRGGGDYGGGFRRQGYGGSGYGGGGRYGGAGYNGSRNDFGGRSSGYGGERQGSDGGRGGFFGSSSGGAGGPKYDDW